MPDNIPASFIPKKSSTIRRSPGKTSRVGLLFLIAVIVFLIATASSAGVFVYARLLERNLESKSLSLERAREAFEISLIEELSRLDARIETSKELLQGHTALTYFFDTLGDSTLRSIRFQSFKFNLEKGGESGILLSGVADNYASIVLQSEALADNKFFKDIIFSNLDVDEFGSITFDVAASVSASLISFEENIQ